MNVHCLQHVSFETPAFIETIIRKHGFKLSTTHLYRGEPLPDTEHEQIDALLVMGGPMGVHDEELCPWLKNEKLFIEKCIQRGIKVAGICLGAQLVAQALGAEITKNHSREIGFFPVRVEHRKNAADLLAGIPESFIPMHWHGDTFSIPSGAHHFASSDVCNNQGFIFKNQCLALQFHLESTEESLNTMIEHCGNELISSDSVQPVDILHSMQSRYGVENRVIMETLLINFLKL